ncbi:MAG: response regulator [Wenzhouxiangella sp.]
MKPSANSPAHQALARLRVLIVDDHDINRDFLQAGLSGTVGEVETARDGSAAVALCRDRRFDVVLMDLHMPHMDGLAACQRIRQSDCASRAALILILTADARPQACDRLLEEGVDGYLNKPTTIAKVIRAILEQVAPGVERGALSDTSVEETRLISSEQALDSANGDPALAARMQRLFAEELGQKLTELDTMIGRGDFDQAMGLLHQWRGSCGFAGAPRLHQACGALRESLGRAPRVSVGAAYLDFVRTAQATRAALIAQDTGPD